MKRFSVSAIALLVLAGASLQAQPDTITIVHVGDSHSRLAPWGPRNASLEAPYGGIARLATAVGMIRATAPNPIAVHTGEAGPVRQAQDPRVSAFA